MAFLEFECFQTEGERLLRPTGNKFSLAGYQLIYQAWTRRGQPLDTGWHVSEEELIQIHSAGTHDSATRRLVIDFHPNATWRIGLVELLDIYAYTSSNEDGMPEWTPLMLRLRDIYYHEYDPPLDGLQKKEILERLPDPDPDAADIVEFLYLKGHDGGWNWGKNGMTNAVFLKGCARDYFRRFF